MSIICDICMEEFQSSFTCDKTPRILECGDTFCTECLRKLKAKDNKIICPICRTESLEEIDKIRINKYIINQVEKKTLSAIQNLDIKDISLNKIDFKFSVAFIGESGVGKTSLGYFYDKGQQPEKTPIATISLENSYKYIKVHNKIVKITLWDTAGQEKFRSLTIGYLRGVHAIY